MSKFMRAMVVAIATITVMAFFVQTAVATPTKTSQCTGCHSGVNVPITATLVSVNSAAAVYNVSAPTATCIAMFSGTAKQSYVYASSGQFTVAPGRTYTIYAVKGPTTSSGIGQASVSPVAPPTDSTAPVTSSNAVASYTGTATIALTATDAGGSGVAHTYYILDAGVQIEGTAIVMAAPGAHTLQFWSVDGAGNIELRKSAAFTITTPDTTPPVTSSNAVASYTGTATIALTATDAGGSGVARTYYKLDAGAQVESRTVTTSAVGTHTVEFWSVDGAGNIETPHKSVTFSVVAAADRTAPVTVSDAVASYVGTATITLTATDAGGSGVAHTYNKLDAGAQVESRTVTTSAVGTHTVEFWSVDAAGNVETPHKSVTVKVNAPAANDRVAPTTTSNAVAYYKTTAAITLTARDNNGGAGVSATYYSLDGALRAAGTAVTASGAGSHTLEFWSVDKAANEELPHKTVNFVIDSVAPTTSSDLAQYYRGPATFTFGAADNAGGSGVSATYFRVDGAAAATGTAASVSAVGSHTVEYWSVDFAGNTEVHKTATFSIDPAAPLTTSDSVETYTAAADITLAATDGSGSGVAHTYYRLDGGSQAEGTRVSVVTAGAHTLEFWSVDAAGNEEQPHKTAGFMIDLAAPTTSSDAQGLYTTRATIRLTAADDGSGVACTYYSLDGSASIEGTSVAVSTLGTHTVEFWSTDRLGNEENPHKSATFRIRPVAVKVLMTRTPSASYITRYRKHGTARYTLSAKLRRSNGSALPGVKAVLQMREHIGDRWESMYSLKSNTSGNVSKAFVKHRKFTAYYRWYVPATEATLSAKTATQKVIIK